ncbi:hypothetical protein pdam_00025768 [Pocillopora damicornis]|uniref:RNA-directed DNA polymerase from mobile element jockey n=1 Tax=Pocillopora damicornis TaxID=46731 RepID=A0A3M6UKQ7_POCDA|nr:hypothetical protein pdam_00025768 [Pocillopora damicornis]
MVAESIADPLTTIINNCIRKYNFPKAWKDARISPIPKVDQLKSEEHFHPISVIPTPSKLFEKLVLFQMTIFILYKVFVLLVTESLASNDGRSPCGSAYFVSPDAVFCQRVAEKLKR